MELVNMSSLGLFGFKPYPFKSDLPYLKITCLYNICCRLIGKS